MKKQLSKEIRIAIPSAFKLSATTVLKTLAANGSGLSHSVVKD